MLRKYLDYAHFTDSWDFILKIITFRELYQLYKFISFHLLLFFLRNLKKYYYSIIIIIILMVKTSSFVIVYF